MNPIDARPEKWRGWARRLDAYERMCAALFLGTPLLGLLLFRYLEGVPLGGWSAFYVATILGGYYLLAALGLMTLAFWAFAAWVPAAIAASGGVLTLLFGWLAVDGVLYRLMRFHADALSLPLAVSSLRGSGLSAPTWALGIAVAIASGILVGMFCWVAGRLPHRRIFCGVMAALCLASCLVGQALHVLAYERGDTRITSLTPRFPLYYPVRSHEAASQHAGLLAAIRENAGGKGGRALAFPGVGFSFEGLSPARRPNILVLLLESWRSDCMNATVTPRIHRLAGRSAVFLDHFSSGNCTTPGVFSLFYGIHPTYWDAVKADAGSHRTPPLVDALSADGYGFGIFADSDFDKQKIKQALFAGIEVREQFDGGTPDQKDLDMNRRLLAFIHGERSARQPFFAFAFYNSSHFNYHYPKESAPFVPAYKLNAAAPPQNLDRTPYFNDYRNAVHYLDGLIGEVIRDLEKTGALRDTIVVVTGDHGEEFNDNQEGYWGHAGNFTGYQVRIPLVIYMPGQPPRRVTAPTCHVDLAPTLLREALGVTAPVRTYSNGYDLFGALPEARPVVVGSYVNYAVLAGDEVSVIYPMFIQRYALWNIRRRARPVRPEILRQVLGEMRRFYRKEVP